MDKLYVHQEKQGIFMNPKDFHNSKVGRVMRAKTGYWAFVPAELPPVLNWSLPFINALSDAERELSKLATLAGNYPFPRILIQPFMRREAVLSSRIEGTRASLTDLYNYESSQLSFLEEGDDVREVFNYVRAMHYGLERLKKLPVSLRLIREMHAKLLENVRGGHLAPGKFRTSQNWIGPSGSTLETATYVPPPVDEMQAALNALETFIHTDTDIPPLVRAGMIHYQFEVIHPFLDGNGRMGRLLMILLLYEWKLLPQPLLNLSVYFEHYRQEYYDRLLAVSQHGKWEKWLIFFLRGIGAQAQESVVSMARLQRIREKYDAIVQADRNPIRMAAVIDFLFARPIFTNGQLASELNMPFKTAGQYIEKLMQAGILEETTGHARNRVFRSVEILRAVEGLEPL